MFRRRSGSNAQRRLSKEGRTLFNMEGDDHHARKTKSLKGKSLFNCLFSTEDDEYVESLLLQCRKSSKHLLADLYGTNVPSLVEKFIFNVIVLILKDGEDEIAKFHTSKKNYKLFLKLGEKALESEDHNTAWLIRNALLNASLSNLHFLKKKVEDIYFFKKTRELYGKYDSSFQNHILDVLL